MSGYSPYGSFHTQTFSTAAPAATAQAAVPPPPPPLAATTSTSTSTLLAEPAVEKIRRHPHYYLIGGDVHFLVSVLCPRMMLVDCSSGSPIVYRLY